MQVDLNIQEVESVFYFYHNWQAGKENKIHKGSCGYCNYGSGMHQGNIRGLNGIWVGPFSSLVLCNDYIVNRLQLELAQTHKCCN